MKSKTTAPDDLLTAVKNDDRESVKAFIKAGADIEARDTAGHTPLYFACNANHDEIARMLIAAGADIRKRDHSDITPLHCACMSNPELALFLIEKGADPCARDKSGTTPLHLACLKGHTSVVRVILNYNAEGSVIVEDGLTPLDCAVQFLKPDNPAREEIIDLFREHCPEMVMEAYCTARTSTSP